MPKPRGQKPRKRANASPDRRVSVAARPPVFTTDLAEDRLRLHLRTDPADPRLVIALPPLFIDLRAEQIGAPAGRCVDDCLTLAYTYSLLGYTAQIRVAQLQVVEARTGRTWVHGTAAPRWEDDLLHGHTVVWLPQAGYLIDVTADQFPPINDRFAGPVIATVPKQQGLQEGFTTDIGHAGLTLHYTLAPWRTTQDVLDHPRLRDEESDHRLRGINVAGAAIGLLTEALTPRRTRVLANQRTAALITAARQTTVLDNPEIGPRFVLTAPGEEARLLTVEELLPAAHTPGPSAVELWPSEFPPEAP